MTKMYNLKLIEIRGDRIDGKFQDFILTVEHLSQLEIIEILRKTILKVRKELLIKEENEKRLDEEWKKMMEQGG